MFVVLFMLSMLDVTLTHAQKACPSDGCPVQVNTLLQSSRMHTTALLEAQADCDGVKTWTGYWTWNDQQGTMDLDLDLKNGEYLVGTGSDSVGDFTIDGEITKGRMRFTKTYESHIVEYDGASTDGGNSFQGTWTIEETSTIQADSGGFEMRPPDYNCITEPPIMDGSDWNPDVGGCSTTRYGCCPDGKMGKIDDKGSNCKAPTGSCKKGGWYASAKGDSCDATCAALGSVCSADQNLEIDTSAEVKALIQKIGGDPGADDCKTGCYYQPGSWKPGKACWYCPTEEKRQYTNVDENDCAAANSKRQRLCYCCEEQQEAPTCSVSLSEQHSSSSCDVGSSYGCDGSQMYVNTGCRGVFNCNGQSVVCESWHMADATCSCAADQVYEPQFSGLCVDGSSNGDNCQCAEESSKTSFAECQKKCDSMVGCTGIAYHNGRHCKVYTQPISESWNSADYQKYTCYAKPNTAGGDCNAYTNQIVCPRSECTWNVASNSCERL